MAGEQTYNYIPVRITEKVYTIDFFYDTSKSLTRKQQMNNAINAAAIKNDLINNEKAIIKFNEYSEYSESTYKNLISTRYFEVIKIDSEIHELISGIAEENIDNYIEEILLEGQWG